MLSLNERKYTGRRLFHSHKLLGFREYAPRKAFYKIFLQTPNIVFNPSNDSFFLNPKRAPNSRCFCMGITIIFTFSGALQRFVSAPYIVSCPAAACVSQWPRLRSRDWVTLLGIIINCIICLFFSLCFVLDFFFGPRRRPGKKPNKNSLRRCSVYSKVWKEEGFVGFGFGFSQFFSVFRGFALF